MKVMVVEHPEMGGEVAFKLLKDALRQGAKTLGLATGSTPLELYRLMRESDLDFSEMTAINLDEYVGLTADNNQSYAHFMQEQLFKVKPFKATYIPNGMAEHLVSETIHYDHILEEYPIDFQILGIGRNGHIGFNEPGTPFDWKTHLVDLDPSTIEANSRFFETIDQVPKQAISMGIASIMAAKTIVLMAYGAEKADAIYQTVHGPITEQVPASILQKHPNLILILDRAAAEKLQK